MGEAEADPEGVLEGGGGGVEEVGEEVAAFAEDTAQDAGDGVEELAVGDFVPKPKGQRGKVARGKALNLLDRFDKYRAEIVGFSLYPGLSPYDNNLAERDVRMMKVREKISGTFRSEDHAKGFCDIRSIISSARKQGRAMLATSSDLISRPSKLGISLAQGF